MRLLSLCFLLTALLSLESSKGEERIGYAYQLFTSKTEAYAKMFLESLPAPVKSKAYIYKTDRGLFTVRFGFSMDKDSLREELEVLKTYGIEALIVRTSPEKAKKPDDSAKEEKAERLSISEMIKRKVRELEEGDIKYRDMPTNGRALENLNRKLEGAKSLIKEVFFGGNNIYLDMLLLNYEENQGVKLLSMKADIEEDSLPLYLIGEVRYREKAPLLENEELSGNFYSYIGVKFSLLKEGSGERKYKERLYRFQCLAEGIFSRVDYAYTYLLGSQVESFRRSFFEERKRIILEKTEFTEFAKELLEKVSEVDRQYKFLKEIIFAGSELEGWEEGKGGSIGNHKRLPPFDINMAELFNYIEERRKRILGKLDRYLREHQDVSWKEVFKDAELDFILRYHITDYGSEGNPRSYFSAGIRFDIPVPYLYSRKRESMNVELLSIKEKVIQRLDKEHSQIVDMAFRLKQNFLHIRNHLKYINQDLLKIHRNLLLWKFGTGKVNYRELVESFLDIYDRLLLVSNYKYINYVYAQKITYLLDIEDRRALMRIFNF